MNILPKLSIIVPVYKTEKKLARCIESIQNQTLKDFELILVDDGSPDKSGQICDEYAQKDSRINVIHQKNKSAAVARNNGIKAACGEYIGFVDSDDYISKNYFDMLIAATKQGADITICNYLSVSPNGNTDRMNHGFKDGSILNRTEIEQILYSNIFSNKNTVGYFQLWNKIFRRDFIIKNNIFINEEMSFGEDMMFVLKCFSECDRIAFCENAGYYYEMTENGLFSKYRRSFIHDISACYSQIIKQTAPQEYNRDDLLPLNLKYFNYINRQFADISKYEKNKFLQIRRVLSNKTVRKIFRELADMSTEQAINAGIEQNELKSARLVKKGFLLAAAFVADYQFNPHFWLRRIKKC